MNIVIMRHGQAVPLAPSDAERALTDTGHRQVESTLSHKSEAFSLPATLWVSPYVRAQETAHHIESTFTHLKSETQPILVPSSSVKALASALETAQQAGVERIILVGHQPLLGDFVQWLAGLAYGEQPLGTASLVVLEAEVIAFDCGEVVSHFHPE